MVLTPSHKVSLQNSTFTELSGCVFPNEKNHPDKPEKETLSTQEKSSYFY